MSRLALLIPVALLACNDAKDHVTADTDVVQTDTYKEDTDPPADTDHVIDPNDTGVAYIIELEGRADVAPRAKLDGYQTLAAYWLLHGLPHGPPRCIYQQHVRDWEHDPGAEGDNPISASQFALCEDCEFAFTVTVTTATVVDHFPWSTAPVPSDTDASDTDTNPPDTNIPPDVVTTGKLNCTSLVDKLGFRSPGDIPTDTRGWAFNASLDGDDDATTGLWMLWADRYNQWAPYSYDIVSTFDPEEGTFQWHGASTPYAYY